MITFTKKPGSLYAITGPSAFGIYATSTCDRYRVSVSRARCGSKGSRGYQYTFTAIDTQAPSKGRSYTEISLGLNEQSNPERVFDAVRRYAATVEQAA